MTFTLPPPAIVDGEIVDLFAGPGGWDVAALSLGLDPIGIEYDADACATRAANGLRTIRADVRTIEPHRFGRLAGLIASPPCPQFSSAGKGYGRLIIAEVCAAVTDALDGLPIEPHRLKMIDILSRQEEVTDPETAALEAALTAEPARWIHAGRPEWIAMEQVPAVLPIWQHYANELRKRGYSVWCGIVSAEQYGVAQTRRRAILIASMVRTVQPPPATHQRYVHGEPAGGGSDCQDDLFGPGLLPWVSMAEALGWGELDRPSTALTTPGAGGGGSVLDGGSNSRKARADRVATGSFVLPHDITVGFPRRYDTGTSEDGYRERDWRRGDEPAFAVTEKARSVVVRTGQNSAQAGGTTEPYERDTDSPAPTVTGQARSWVLSDRQPNGAERTADEPAPTITSSLDNGNKAWVLVDSAPRGTERDEDEPAPSLLTSSGRNKEWVLNTRRDQKPDGSTQTRPADSPAPTFAASADGQWVFERPATTIMGDSRTFPPGGHHTPGAQSAGSIRLAVEEAAVLQSFPTDYRWTGTKTARFRQIGNAVPPLLSRAVLQSVTGG